MPSFLHEALVEILRGHPELVLTLLRDPKRADLPAYDAVVADSADLGSATPQELAADCVLRVLRNGQTVLVVVLEIQLAQDPNKLFSWPAYAVAARSRHRCDVALVVVTPYFDVVAMAASFSLPDHRVQVYYDLIKAALSGPATEAFLMLPQNYQYQDEGLRRAKAEGKAEGQAEGELAATASALLGVLEARGFVIGSSARNRISSCSSLIQLRAWHLAAVSASSVDDALLG
jgi:hypothetical protein